MFGLPNHYQGGFVLLSYVVLMAAAMLAAGSRRHVIWVLWALCASALVIGIIAVFQGFGCDVFLTDFGRTLILPPDLQTQSNRIGWTHSVSTAYGTLHNPNYLGSYMAMLCPLSLGLFAFARNRPAEVAFLCFFGLMLAALLASRSRAGLVGTVVSSGILVLLMRKDLISHARSWCVMGIAAVLVTVCLNGVSGGPVANSLRRTLSDMRQLLQSPPREPQLKQVFADGNTVRCETSEATLAIAMQHGGVLRFDDGSGHLLMARHDPKAMTITFSDPRYRLYSIRLDRENLLQLDWRSASFQFHWSGKQFTMVNRWGQPVVADATHNLPAPRLASFASGRGYIWIRTIPLLKKTLFLGFGPDTFAAHFPQNDVVIKANVYADPDMIVDKPHSLYLQVAVETGVVSLIALLSLFAWYTAVSVRLYGSGRQDTPSAQLGVTLFSAFCGYAVAGVFNDSAVPVAPVFWTLLGLGIAINCQLESRHSAPRRRLPRRRPTYRSWDRCHPSISAPAPMRLPRNGFSAATGWPTIFRS
jgi:hypothetical protein